MIELLEQQRKVRVLLRAETGDIDHKLEEHRGSLESAIKQKRGVTSKPLNYCIDCTQAYRNRMIEKGLCARPHTRFVAKYSPLTNEATLEGDPLIHLGRYAPGADPRSDAAGAAEGISFPQREEVEV